MRIIFCLPLLLAAQPLQAEILAAAPTGFTVRESFQSVAPAAKIWEALLAPARWWDDAHTWSGNAANMTLEPKAGGCWCETLANGGSVQHMTVDFLDPEKTLRLRGALGPLGSLAVTGVMGVAIESSGAGSKLTLSYQVSGSVPVDLQGIAADVDAVLAEQTARLKAAAEKP
jgi:hypothetical protein